MKKSTIFMVVLMTCVLMVGLPISQASVEDEGADRYVVLEVSDASDGVDYTGTLNMSFPEDISESHTLTGEITLTNDTGEEDLPEPVTFEVAIEFENETDTVSFESGEVTMQGHNETADIEIEIELEPDDYEATITFETKGDGVSEISEDEIEVTVIGDMAYSIRSLVGIMVIFFGFIIVLMILKWVAGFFTGIFE